MNIFIHVIDKFYDYLEVPQFAVLTVAFVSLTNIELMMKIGLLLFSGLYTAWKWRTEYIEKKLRKKKEEEAEAEKLKLNS